MFVVTLSNSYGVQKNTIHEVKSDINDLIFPILSLSVILHFDGRLIKELIFLVDEMVFCEN
jgi:hypothetical protein